MRSDEGIQLPLFDMDKWLDTRNENHIIFVPETKTHVEFTSLPLPGDTDIKYCISEIGGYGGMKNHKWLVVKVEDRKTSEPEIFNSITEAMEYVETLTGKTTKFRKEG